MKKADNDVLNNPATLQTQEATRNVHDCCENHLLFAMQDNHHSFSLSINTALECLYIAQNEGAVPDLPDEWWHRVRNYYNLNIPHFDKPERIE